MADPTGLPFEPSAARCLTDHSTTGSRRLPAYPKHTDGAARPSALKFVKDDGGYPMGAGQPDLMPLDAASQ